MNMVQNTGMERFRRMTVAEAQVMLGDELAGGRIDREDEFYMTPALYAANTGNNAVLKVFLEAGANPNHCGGPANHPVLHFAASSKLADVETVSLLLDAGADVNGVSKGLGATALQKALDRGDPRASEIALALIEHGADCDQEDGGPVPTPLGQAVRYLRDPAVVRAMLDRGANPDRKGGTSLSPALHDALREEREDECTDTIVSMLIEAGADVNGVDKHGRTALHLAARRSGDEVLFRLLEAGADPGALDNGGGTALHEAAAFSSGKSVQALVEAGAPLDAKTEEFRQTALVCAVIEGNEAAVEILIAAGADVGLRDYAGMTALHFACEERRETDGVIQSLLNAGLSPLERDEDGRTPIGLAQGARWPESTMRSLKNAVGPEAGGAGEFAP